MSWIEILVGLGLLTLGRALFWVFVGGAGFAAGLWLMQAFFPGQPQSAAFIAGAVGAVAGVVLAKFVKSVAVNVGGFLGGGVIGLGLARMIGPGIPDWIAFIVVGLLGMLVVRMAFDMALLLISSIVGAMLIVRNLVLPESLQTVAVVVVAAAGVLVQWSLKKRGTSEKDS